MPRNFLGATFPLVGMGCAWHSVSAVKGKRTKACAAFHRFHGGSFGAPPEKQVQLDEKLAGIRALEMIQCPPLLEKRFFGFEKKSRTLGRIDGIKLLDLRGNSGEVPKSVVSTGPHGFGYLLALVAKSLPLSRVRILWRNHQG